MQKRRELIKKIAFGASWTTPVVQSIVLPAHAQTSATTTAEPTTTIAPTTTPEPVLAVSCMMTIGQCEINQGFDTSVDLVATVTSNPTGGTISGITVTADITFNGNPLATGISATTDAGGVATFPQQVVVSDPGGPLVATVSIPSGATTTCNEVTTGC